MLQLHRPLVFLDCETTGLNREKDRIVSLTMKKVNDLSAYPFKSQVLTMLINPGMPIPESSTAIHGITDADVANCPLFEAVAVDIHDFLKGCDIAGYGSNYYDVPLLFNEFSRALIYWEVDSIHLIDAGNLFKIKESRSLGAAVRFYCGRSHDSAHSSEGDVNATMDVFAAQLQRYPDLPQTIEELAHFTNHSRKRADVSGKFYYDENEVLRYGFGPHRDKPVEEHPEYLEWIYRADFPADTKNICAELLGYATERVWPENDEPHPLFGL